MLIPGGFAKLEDTSSGKIRGSNVLNPEFISGNKSGLDLFQSFFVVLVINHYLYICVSTQKQAILSSSEYNHFLSDLKNHNHLLMLDCYLYSFVKKFLDSF